MLDATKHQDDKIGRFLTAIAFLFTGAIAFLARTEVLTVRYSLDTHNLPLPAIFLGLFLALSVLSVLLLLTGLGPNLKLPLPERGEGGGATRKSRIYFYSIAGTRSQEWKDLWKAPGPSLEDMTTTYIDETHNLATKTDFKFSRTNEARAAFSLALMFLALAVVLGFKGLSSSSAGSPLALSWDLPARGYTSAIVGVFAFLLAYDYLRFDQELDQWFEQPNYWWRLAPLYCLLVALPALVVVLLHSGTRASHIVTWGASGLSVAPVTVFVLYGGPHRRVGWTWRLALGIPSAAAAFYFSHRFLQADDYVPRMVLALVAIVILEGPRILIASLLWHRRRRRARGTDKQPRLILPYVFRRQDSPAVEDESGVPPDPNGNPQL